MGRKRKARVKRYKSGRVVPIRGVDKGTDEAQNKRLCYVPASCMKSKESAKYTGWPLGILYLRELITEEQFQAARFAAIIINRKLKMVGAPHYHAHAICLEDYAGGTAMEWSDDEVRFVTKKYQAIHEMFRQMRDGRLASTLFYDLALIVDDPAELAWLPTMASGDVGRIKICHKREWAAIAEMMEGVERLMK